MHPPTIDQEAVRDLCRAREDAVTDRTRARHRLAKLLLRRGIADGRNSLRAPPLALASNTRPRRPPSTYLRAIEGVEERLRTLEQELAACAASDDYREAVGLLRCFRGVDTVTAMTVLAELGDVTRSAAADVLPRAHAERVQQRRRTWWRARGTTATRRGWGQRCASAGRASRAGPLADRAQTRLYRRHRRLAAHGKPSVVANVAVARELAGCLWAVLNIGARQQAAA